MGQAALSRDGDAAQPGEAGGSGLRIGSTATDSKKVRKNRCTTVRRELFSSAQLIEEEPYLVADWKQALELGVTLGRQDAPIQLIEFGDFECPFCASYNSEIKAVRQQFGDRLALTFLHFPLDNHSHAEQAAIAAECAADQGRFEQMHDHFYANQQLLKKPDWALAARTVGVSDMVSFEQCMKDSIPLNRVRAARDLGIKSFKVQGTPTIVINGWVFPTAPNANELAKSIEAVAAGKPPGSKKPWWSLG